MQLLLTTKSHFTMTLWMPVRLPELPPANFQRMQLSLWRRVDVCV
jgi:hypothetical protein